MWRLRTSLVVAASLVGIVLTLPCPEAVAAAAAPEDALHQVLPGDNLHLLAGYYYGDARQWERIWHANRDQVSNPNRIRRGALLRIPDATPPEESYADFVARARRMGPATAFPTTGAAGPVPGAASGGPTAVPSLPGGSAQPPPPKQP
jgi:hypothetical protein